MAISKIHGQMLRPNLLRDGDDVGFDNSLLHIDVFERRVGINTNAPEYELSVNGTLNVGEFVVTGNTIGTLNGDIELSPNVGAGVRVASGTPSTLAYFDSNNYLVGSQNLTWDGAVLGLDGAAQIGTVVISSNTISSDTDLNLVSGSGGNINITPSVGGAVNISGLSLSGLSPEKVVITDQAGNLTQSPRFRFNETTEILELDGLARFHNVEILPDLGDSSSGTLTVGNLFVVADTITANTPNTALKLGATGDGLVQVLGRQGFVIPTGFIAERPATPLEGTMRLQSDGVYVEIYDGANWLNVGPNFFEMKSQLIVGDGTATLFLLDTPVAEEENILVSINGVTQVPAQSYLVSGTHIQFADPLQPSDTAEIRFILTGETLGVMLANPDVDGGFF